MKSKETNDHIVFAITDVTNTVEAHSSVKGDFGRPRTVTHVCFKYREPSGTYHNWDIVCERKYCRECFGLTNPIEVYCSWEKLSLYKVYPKVLLEEPQLVSFMVDDRDEAFADKIKEVSSITLDRLLQNNLHVSLHAPLLPDTFINALSETLTDILDSLEEELNILMNKMKESSPKPLGKGECVFKKSISKSQKTKGTFEEKEQSIEPVFDPYTRKLLKRINKLVDLKNTYAAVLEKHGLLKSADKLYCDLMEDESEDKGEPLG